MERLYGTGGSLLNQPSDLFTLSREGMGGICNLLYRRTKVSTERMSLSVPPSH